MIRFRPNRIFYLLLAAFLGMSANALRELTDAFDNHSG